MSIHGLWMNRTEDMSRAAILMSKLRRKSLIVIELRQVGPQINGAISRLERAALHIVLEANPGVVAFRSKPPLVAGHDAPGQSIRLLLTRPVTWLRRLEFGIRILARNNWLVAKHQRCRERCDDQSVQKTSSSCHGSTLQRLIGHSRQDNFCERQRKSSFFCPELLCRTPHS